MLCCSQGLVETPKFRQGKRDVVEAELSEAELRWPTRWTVPCGRALLNCCSAPLEEAHRLPVLAEAPGDLSEPEVRLDRKAGACDALRQRERASTGRERLLEIASDPGVIAGVGRDAREPGPVVELFGDALGLPEVADQIVEAAHRVQALPQLDADVDVPLVDLAARRQAPKRAQGLLEARHGFVMRRAYGGTEPRLVEKGDRLFPQFPAQGVMSEALGLLGGALGR